MNQNYRYPIRSGSVYIAVLGTSLIVTMLALSALALQRIQNRILAASADIQQAQLNAKSAIDLGLLTMRQDENWRTTYSGDNHWFTNRGIGAGTSSLEVIDPIDGDLDDDANDPIVMTGLGTSGEAEQRIEVTVDPRKEPLGCLRAAVVAGDAIQLSGSVLRTSNSATVAANSVTASSSTVYGAVQAVTVSGATYAGTATEIDAEARPELPDWDTVFDYYIANGTPIDVNYLPQWTANNFGRNPGVENPLSGSDWIGDPPGVGTATVSRSTSAPDAGSYCLKVENRASWQAGAAQRIDGFVEPGQQYLIQARIRFTSGVFRQFNMSLCTKGTGGAAQSTTSLPVTALVNNWTLASATITAPSWNGALEYAFLKIASADANTVDFFIDSLTIREVLSGRLIYQQTLGPGVNPFGAPNSQGIYWINCSGQKLYIERSKIRGTLLVINPGSDSCIGPGPINWSPAVPGFPALMVTADDPTSADFTIAATNRTLGEADNSVNYNPVGVPDDDFGEDADMADTYPSEIRGLVVIRDELTFQNNATIRGQVIAGGDITSSGGTLDVDYQPDSLLSPPPGFTAASTYVRRPGSTRKTVLP
jgi:Carbohydrate binding domain